MDDGIQWGEWIPWDTTGRYRNDLPEGVEGQELCQAKLAEDEGEDTDWWAQKAYLWNWSHDPTNPGQDITHYRVRADHPIYAAMDPWGPWIEHTPTSKNQRPDGVQADDLCQVTLRDPRHPAEGTSMHASLWTWETDGDWGDITHFRLHKDHPIYQKPKSLITDELMDNPLWGAFG